MSAGQRWQKYGSGTYDFTATEKFIIQAELKVVTSTYNPSIGGTGNWRAGYYLAAYDDSTRWIAFGITSDGIRVSRGPIGSLSDKNAVWFGDGSGWAWSQTQLHYVSFGDVGTPVPIPGAIIFLGPGLVGLAAIRRKMIR